MGSLDQSPSLTDSDIRIFDTVDSIVDAAIVAGDPVPAFEYGKGLVRASQVQGVALAKLCYKLKKNWLLFQSAGADDNFEDFAFVHMGLAVDTIKKYTGMWENILENPKISKEIKFQLMGRKVGELLLMSPLIGEGVENNVLQELISAPDANRIREIVSRERGVRTSATSALRSFIQTRDGGKFPRGILYVTRGGRNPKIFGTLDIDSDDEDVKQIVARHINSTRTEEK
jgi:hypothetical protein